MMDCAPARLSPLCCSVALAAGLLTMHAATVPAGAAPVSLSSALPSQESAETPAQAVPEKPSADAGLRRDVRVRFNFKGQSYDQILDWFSRNTGLPIVREVPVPAGVVDYIYPGEYTLAQALETLNILLQTQGVMLRVEEDRLFLQKLGDMKRENVPTFVGRLPAEITNDQIVTVVMPLMNARAVPVAEQLKNLVAEYGSVTPLEQQNAVIVVETAAQVRRLQSIITELDQQDVENIIEFIPLRYAKADQMLKSLTALMGERVVEYIINAQDGKRSKIEENRVAGLVLAADARTNAIVARGSRSKIDQVRTTIELLDVEADERGATASPRVPGRPSRVIRTVTLERQTPVAAKAKLDQLYAPMPAERRPTIVGFEDTNRIAIAGAPDAVDEGIQILRELEGDGGRPLDPDAQRTLAVLPLANSAPDALVASIKALLTPRQQAAITLLPGPDGRSILVNAMSDDAADVRRLVEVLDRPNVVEYQFRAIPVAGLDAAALVQKARTAFERLAGPDGADAPPLPLVEHDASTGTLAVSGPRRSVALYEKALGEARSLVPAPRTTKLVALERTKADAIVGPLRDLVGRALAADPSNAGAPPVIEAVPATNSVQVVADAQQMALVEAYAAALDRGASPDQPEIRAYRVERADPASVARTLQELASRGALSGPAKDGRPPVPVSISVDPQSRTLVVAGDASTFERVDDLLRRLDASSAASDVRMIPLRHARAADIKSSLDAMASTTLVADGGGTPTITAIADVNGLLVAASPRQHEIVAAVVQGLDVERGTAQPLRILQLRTADAVAIAQTLSANYAKRTAEERIAKPVSVAADAQTNTLLVSAHPDVLPEIQAIVDQLNGSDLANRSRDGEGREIRIFPLKVAQARELAKTIDEMYPEQPVPVDPRGRPRPELAKPREVVVRADAQTNSLIVDAPIARMAGFEQLVEQLDRQQLAVDSEIRTWRIAAPRLESIAATLRQLAASNQLGAAQGTSQTTVSTEPVSGTLIVSGPREIFPKVDEVLKGVGGGDLPATALRTYRLEKARAESLAPMLRQVLAGRVRQEMPDAAAQIDRLLDVTAEKRSNALIVSAPMSLVPLVDELVKQLDTGGGAAGEPVVRVHPLTFADANAVAQSLMQALPGVISPATGEPMNVRVVPAGGSNALLLVGLAADLDEVEKLIAPMDARPANDAVDAKTFPLKNAEAAQVAPTLERLLNDQQETDPRIVLERLRRSRGQADAAPRVRVEADARTNSLIVSGPQRVVALAETLVAQLDAPDQSSERIYKTFTPERVPAVRLVEAVRPVLESTRAGTQRSTLVLLPEAQSGAVVVIGTEAETVQALDALAAFDAAALPTPQVDLRIVSLRHSDAATVAGAIGPILADRSRWPAQLAAAAAAGRTVVEPRVTADPAANRILIAAPRELFAVADELVAQLDVARTDGAAVDTRVFTLVNADAIEVARALTTAAGGRSASQPAEPKPVIAAETSSNAVVATAAPAALDAFEALVTKLDSGVRADAVQVRTVQLRNARAEQVAPLVEKLLAPQPPQPGPRGRPQPVSTEPPVRVAADTRLNAVIVSATPATLNVAEQMVEQLDRAPAETQARTVRVLAVANADAAEIAESLADVFREGAASEVPPTIRVNGSSNALIVRATEAQFGVIEQVVRTIDKASITTSRQMRTLSIDPSKASAEEIARMLERLLERSDGGAAVEVVPVEDLLKKYGGEAAPKKTSDAGSRPFGSIAEAIAALAFAGVLEQAPADATEDEPDVTIAVDPATNSLVVLGSPKSIERIQKLVEQAQRELPAEASSIRAVTMPPGMDLERIRGLVEQTMQRMTPAGGKPGDLARRVAVFADAETRSLVVAASDRDFEVVGQLIATFAKNAVPEKVVVKNYRLEHVGAERAARGLRDLLGGANPRDARLRELAVVLDAGGTPLEASFDASQIRAIPDPANNAMLVIAPADAIAFLDRFIELADQTPASNASAVRLFPLKHARAEELVDTVGRVFSARARGIGGQVQAPEFGADPRTNTLVVTASAETLREVESLVSRLDAANERDRRPLEIIDLAAADARTAAELLTRTVVGDDQARRESTLIVADEGSGTLLVRADDGALAEIRTILREIDRPATGEFKVRSIVLERADAGAVAQALQRFYDDRARIATNGRARRDGARRVSIVGDARSATLLVAASDADFTEIKELVAQFDTAKAAQSLEFRVYQLAHARADEISGTVQSLLGQLLWTETMRGGFNPGTRSQNSSVAVRPEPRMNALIVTGRGDAFALVDQIVEQLDQPAKDGQRLAVRAYPVRAGQLDAVADLVRDAMGVREPRWNGDDSGARVRIVPVPASRTLVVSASEKQHAEIGVLLEGLDRSLAGGSRTPQVIPVEFAQADEIARTLEAFLAERGGPDVPTIMASGGSNALVVSATAEDLATIRDLLAKLDQPTSAGDRALEIVSLERGQALEIARMIGEQFGRRGGNVNGVIVTPDARTNSIVVNAPAAQLEQVKALIARLDGPTDAAETIIRTYALTSAKADDVARVLGQTLQLDARGRTSGISVKPDESSEPVQVVARIAADRRSNSLIVTATVESFPVIEKLIRTMEDVPAASPVEFRVLPLRHAIAADVATTLRRLVRDRVEPGETPPSIDSNRLENQLVVGATADQFRTIEEILRAIDAPSSRPRTTDFVGLKFAEAEKVRDALSYFYGRFATEADTPDKQNVRIVADTASNSLVISAAETEWEGIRQLIAKLDSEEYDAGLQLRVLPLMHADARSVATAINEAFRGPGERRRAAEGERRRDDEPQQPTTLVRGDDWVSAAAEEQTNTVVVSANRQNLERIEAIVKQMDIADFDRLPAPKLIPVRFGNPEQLAQAIDRIYAPPSASSRDQQKSRLRIVADASSNALIVRAPEDEYRQILAIAEALQQQATEQGLNVHLLPLKSASATRVAGAIREAFEARAQQAKLPFSVQVDAAGNALVVASTGPLFEEIRAIATQMDALSPGAGQAVFVIDLEHVDPEAAARVIQQIGLDKPQPEGSTSRVVVEPVKVSTVPGRAAIIVVANPGDRDTIIGLVKAIDAEPTVAESAVRIVQLKTAKASAVAALLNDMLKPGAAPAPTGIAKALQEQIRRLSVQRDGGASPDLKLDLTEPVKVIADEAANAVLIASTATNVDALEEAVKMLDRLPVADAVSVSIFPLENIAAQQFARVVNDLFEQGKNFGRAPISEITGLPAGTAGRALMAQIAVTIDERTNTVIVAGPEDAVALVDVLKRKLDTDVGMGWVEPKILQLRYADAEDLAATLQAVLVEGQTDLPESSPMQKQIGRLRMARMNGDGGEVLEGDVFVAMSNLLLRPEPQLNAIVVVGSRANVDIVETLVRQLDVEAASPAALVRVYPLENASAARLATTVTQLFEAQRAARSIRDEDRLRAIADERTNALIVSTSPRSFVVFEELLKSLDQKLAPEIKEIRTLALVNASAARLAPMIQELMDARLERLRKVQPETADLERASIVADGRTNALVVAAGNDTYAVIERLAQDLDRPETAESGLLQVLQVRKANLDRVASALNQIMERRYADLPNELERRVRPLILVDPRTSSLLVSAGPDDLRAIEELIAKLEATPTNPAVGVEVIALESSRAEELAPRLQTLMRERLQSLGQQQQPSDAVAITADPTSNALIVAASAENVAVVRSLIEVLTKAAEDAIGGQSIEIVQLAKSRAVDIVNMLEEMYVAEENRRRGQNSVKAAPEPRLNAVLLSGSAPDIDTMRRMIAQLDGARPSSVVEIRYIPLASANVIETVNLIQTVLSGASIAGGGANTQQAIVLKYLRRIVDPNATEEDASGLIEMEVSAAVRQSISLTPDVRTNTVIVRAPRESMELIERMVKDLDGSQQGSQNIRIFRLVNADADQTARLLTELFSLERRGNLYVLKPRDEIGGAPTTPGGAAAAAVGAAAAQSNIGLFGTDLTLVPDERQQLSITVDNRTNSLLVSGTPNYLSLVEKVVQELDAQEANTRDTFVYRLKNAAALEVARVLTEFVQQDQQKILSTLSADQRPSAQKLLDQEVTIVGDEKSNSVLVNASPRFMERVKAVIDELDVDPPQVMIQVLLAEVTLDMSEELGLQFTRFSVGDVNVAGGFGLPRSGFASGSPNVPGIVGLAPALFGAGVVPNIAIGNADFDLLLNALQSQNRVELLSNPSVMVANNTEGRIQVGDTVRLPTAVSFNSVGQQSSVAPEEVGVILTVTPSINPDGFVRMTIEPEISRISKESTKISENFQSPIINRRRATTTVTVKDGQTVVIGGLIQDRFERIERKIPLLGDIPLIGALFRNKSESASKTELLIVLTPHVVRNPQAVDRQTGNALDKATLSPELMEQLRRGELDGVRGTIDKDGRLVHPTDGPEAGKPRRAAPGATGSSGGPEGDAP
jgi:type II secretory pathway component GspD/PulD (secretin)